MDWSSLLTPGVVIAAIAASATYVTARPAVADVGLKRRLETAARFAELAEIANNREGNRGLYEQIAAIHLLASFASREPHLRRAGIAVLGEIIKSATGPSGAGYSIRDAAVEALGSVPVESIERARKRAQAKARRKDNRRAKRLARLRERSETEDRNGQ